MDFYQHRFDFLRFVDKDINFNYGIDWNAATPEEIEEHYNLCKDFILPNRKFKLENGKELGQDNIVTGSTCFFVNTGELFIARRYRVEGDDIDTVGWYKVGEELGENQIYYTSYSEADNPYYEANVGPEPVV